MHPPQAQLCKTIIALRRKISQQLLLTKQFFCKELNNRIRMVVNKFLPHCRSALIQLGKNMVKSALTGSRIRERRIMAGHRQSKMATAVGISASYLNLIEHNRRRIGGKLLLDIAQFLDVEPALLVEGAEAALITGLREAADRETNSVEVDRVDEFAGRFPGWARLLMAQHLRIEALEHTVETLTDRLAHDPQLAASLHEVISTVTAIRSTAAILVDTKELEREWRDRFNRNINEDSKRLAESSLELVTYLDKAQDTESSLKLPQDEFDAFLRDNGFHFSKLETGEVTIADVIATNPVLQSGTAKAMAEKWLTRYQGDAVAMPLDTLAGCLQGRTLDPAFVAKSFGVDLARAMRRLASVPADILPVAVGLVACDASGALFIRKAIDGFSLPRTGAACVLWPLFQALSRPLAPISQVVEQAGPSADRMMSYAIAQPVGALSFDDEPIIEAYMFIVPVDSSSGAETTSAARVVGASCRVCPKQECAGRREQSIMLDGF